MRSIGQPQPLQADRAAVEERQALAVPLSSFAVALLRGQLARRQGDWPFVFPAWGKEGQPLQEVRRTWSTAKRRAGWPPSRDTLLAAKAARSGLHRVNAIRGTLYAPRAIFLLNGPEEMRAMAARLVHAWDGRRSWHPDVEAQVEPDRGAGVVLRRRRQRIAPMAPRATITVSIR